MLLRKNISRNYYYCDQDENSLGLCFKSMYLTLIVAIFTSNFIFSMFKSFHTCRNINISNLHVGVIDEPALHNLLLQHHLRHQNVCHLSSTWCQISIIIIALLLISTLKARIFMIKSISIILTRVTWSSFLEAAPELSYYQNIIWKWRRCWISHWLSTLSVGISLSISNFEQQIGNPHRKFKQQGCEIIVYYNMGKIFWTQENDCKNLFSSRSYKSSKFCQIRPFGRIWPKLEAPAASRGKKIFAICFLGSD